MVSEFWFKKLFSGIHFGMDDWRNEFLSREGREGGEVRKGSAGVSPNVKDVCNETLPTATGTVALPIPEREVLSADFKDDAEPEKKSVPSA